MRDQILESISQIDGQIVIKLFGDDLTALRANGRDVLARDGLNVRLTIDSHIQNIVEQALDDAVGNIEP